jgi:hypothetical protein
MAVDYPTAPYPSQKQPMPGSTAKMDPHPDHGDELQGLRPPERHEGGHYRR